MDYVVVRIEWHMSSPETDFAINFSSQVQDNLIGQLLNLFSILSHVLFDLIWLSETCRHIETTFSLPPSCCYGHLPNFNQSLESDTFHNAYVVCQFADFWLCSGVSKCSV